MSDKLTYTKIFLNQLGKSTSDDNVKAMLYQWWYNTRQKDSGGLRLTVDGYEAIKEAGIATYDIPYPKDMPLTAQVIIYLDHFIDCPYFLDNRSIIVTHEKKAVELTLFSGDLRKYGLIKAMKRQQKDEN